jgi:hypothetical protein
VVYQRQIRAADNFIKCAKRFQEQIAQFDFNFWRNPGQAGANTARSAIVTLPKSGG